ncbi:MAG TPA: histidine kinase [Thermoanaerobaculia bacterium]|nr:histidine kinase [Thermoanaerobaculia bacterium]
MLNRRTLRNAAVITFLVTLAGLLNFSIVRTSWLAEENPRPAWYPFVWEMSGAYTFLLLLPLLIFFMNRYPIGRRDFWYRLPLHLGVFAAFAVTHTLLMWGTRELIYYLLGWGVYDYGSMPYRFLMEGQKQLIIYWAVYAVLRIAAYTRANRERDLSAARLEQELAEARLSALKLQLQPHFLFNTLNMIASHVRDDPGTAEAMINHLSSFLRATLRNSARQEVSLGEEIEFLDSYLEIMKARFEERLLVTISLPAEVRNTVVPHLLLQPLVENSIAHSIRDHSRRAEIRVAAERDGDRLRLLIDDNGAGLTDGGAPPERGIGLSNTAARLRQLYGECQRLDLANRPEGGSRLTIELPWHRAAEQSS